MNINSMLSVRDAAALLGCDKKDVREKLELGQLKGEKRLDGGKEKWFVPRKAVEAELAKMPIVTPKGTYSLDKTQPKTETGETQESPARRRTRTTARVAKPAPTNTMFFGVDEEAVDVPIVEERLQIEVGEQVEVEELAQQHVIVESVSESGHEIDIEAQLNDVKVHGDSAEYEDYFVEDEAETVAGSGPSLMTVVQVMVKEFNKRLEDHREVNTRLVQELADQQMQLRLLPDLQRKADEVYKLEFEAAALRQQITCMEHHHFNTVVALERAEQEAIPQLEARLEEEYRMHSIEVARLREQIQLYANRVQVDRQVVEDLESALYEMMEQKERDKRAAQAEIEKAKQSSFIDVNAIVRAETEKIRADKDRELAEVAEVVARYKREKEFELELLSDETDLITHEKNIALARLNERLAEVAEQEHCIVNLRNELKVAIETKDAETRAARMEADRVSRDMGAEIAALNERLTKINEQLEVSRMPWWKRWFLPSA